MRVLELGARASQGLMQGGRCSFLTMAKERHSCRYNGSYETRQEYHPLHEIRDTHFRVTSSGSVQPMSSVETVVETVVEMFRKKNSDHVPTDEKEMTQKPFHK